MSSLASPSASRASRVESTSSVPSSMQGAIDSAKAALETLEYAAAFRALAPVASEDTTGEVHGLIGDIWFLSENYTLAQAAYESATKLNPDSATYRERLAHAAANVVSDVATPAPTPAYPTREELLAPPRPGALPTPPVGQPTTIKESFLNSVGVAIGGVSEGTIGALSTVAGWMGTSNAVWTNWYESPYLLGIMKLAHIRHSLNQNNLSDPYPEEVRSGFADPALVPPVGVTHFRSADGTWNNLADPKEGAAGTRFSRNTDPLSGVPKSEEELLSPNPREISRVLFPRGEDGMKEVPFLNMLAATWVQFMTHDWVSHGENMTHDYIKVPITENDPDRDRFRGATMFVPRTQPDLTRSAEDGDAPGQHINEVTHWWDGSQIYGSDDETQRRLRSFSGGRMRLQEDGRLPLGANGVEDTGFNRNWWVGLTLMHTLFVKEHNAICEKLQQEHPEWDDNRLFHTARLINAALMAKIHTVEWTPAILPNKMLASGMNANWFGLHELPKSQEDRTTVSPLNVRSAVVGGIVGNPVDKQGKPYFLSEEFTEVYRLHSLLPDHFEIRSADTHEVIDDLDLGSVRQAGSSKITEKHEMKDLLYSFGNLQPGQLVLNNFPKMLLNLSVPGNPVYDLGAVDILRARERGVPRYNEFRRQLLMNPITSFEDFFKSNDHDVLTEEQQDLVAKLKTLYNDDIETIDLLVGTLAENVRPHGFGFGETLFQVFILNASRRLQADRFFTTDYDEEHYTRAGLDWIDGNSLKSVLTRHHPELVNTGLSGVNNAFEPWDEEALDSETHKARHPLDHILNLSPATSSASLPTAGEADCAVTASASAGVTSALDHYETGFLFGEKVTLQGFSEVSSVLDILESSEGVVSSGEMTPGQVLRHCARSIEMSMEGYPEMKSGLFRATLGKVASWLFLNLGFMFHSLDDSIPGATPMEPLSLKEGTEALRAAMKRFETFEGPYKPHFAYGELPKESYERVHAMHVANHLEGLVIQ